MKLISTLAFIVAPVLIQAQNVGIGTNNPKERLEVVGNIKSNGLVVTVGNPYDFLIQFTAAGQVSARKGYGALALHYIICVDGSFPNIAPSIAISPFLAEIKLLQETMRPVAGCFAKDRFFPLFRIRVFSRC
jgi:hypothetical protein